MIDLEHPVTRATFDYPELLPVNPRQVYRATQHLAGQVVCHPPGAWPGLRAPAVRSRHRSTPPPAGSQTVLFVGAAPPALELEQVWDLGLEFRDLVGRPIAPGSPRADWERVYATVSRPRLAAPKVQVPPGFLLGVPLPVPVSHT